MKNKINEKIIIRSITVIGMILIIVFLLKNNSEILPSIEKYNFSANKTTPIEQKIKNTPNQKEENNLIYDLISPEEYKEKLESNEYILLDIRTIDEYEDEKIANGINIDFLSPDFKEKLNELDKDKKYIFHCRSGSRGARALPIFKELEFKEIYELDGGIENWKTNYQIIK